MNERVVFSSHNAGVRYRQRIGLFKYKNYWGIEDISFSLNSGETLGVIGGNGAGKSTLLRLIAGIIDPDNGSVSRDPKLSASLLALNAGFRPELGGRENAILGGMLLGMSYQEVIDRLPEIREFCDIGDFFDQPVSTYSTGMRARLGFATAYFSNPDILLVDEVLGVGDQRFREKSSRVMRDRISSNKTVVLVSHSLESIAELCDRVLWIERGRLIAIGSASLVVEKYREAIGIALRQLRK